MAEIVWENPPGRDSKYAEIAMALREKPGEWARILGPETKHRVASLRTSLLQPSVRGIRIGGGHYECRMKTIDGKAFLWARFVSEEA